MNKLLFLCFCFLFQGSIFAEKVLIITSAYNRSDFVEIQHETFKKFLRDDYEFVVFNDARILSLQNDIKKTCSRLGVKCINIPQAIHTQPYLKREPAEGFHDPAVRNANVVQYALNNLGFDHRGILVIVDSDMFLVKPFSFKEFLSEYDLGGVPQMHAVNGIEIPYLWIGLAFLDMEKLPERRMINFNCGMIQGVPVDAGGYTYHYLHKYPELKITYFNPIHSSSFSCNECLRKRAPSETIRDWAACTHNQVALQSSGLDAEQIRFLHSGLGNSEFYINGTFFHYRCGTNWDNRTSKYQYLFRG